MVKLTGTFTLEKTFEIPEVKSAFKKAVLRCAPSCICMGAFSHLSMHKDSRCMVQQYVCMIQYICCIIHHQKFF